MTKKKITTDPDNYLAGRDNKEFFHHGQEKIDGHGSSF